jgi:histidyl-tRNA synthetase
MLHTLERGKRYESLDKNIARIAYAYGFSAPPVALSRKHMANVPDGVDAKTGASLALISASDAGTLQSWGVQRHGQGSVISFSVSGARHPVAHAIVLKTALAIAEQAGYTDLSVSISSVGDQESRKRFTRELTNFFRKQQEALTADLRHLAARDPDAAYQEMLRTKHELAQRAPRSIDYLSEASRKTMLSTLTLLEAVGIPYAMNARLVAYQGVNAELVFAIEGTAKNGERVTIASGGRFDEFSKRERKSGPAVAVSVELGKRVECDEVSETPACFVVHVGDAAKLKSFAVIEALWRAHVAVGEALLAENLRDQIQKGASVRSRYLAIIGQREALDGTVIVRNTGTQMQTVLPADKLAMYVSRGHRN